MLETQTKERRGTLLAIPRTVERALGDVVHQAFDRLLSSDVEVKTAGEAKRLLADSEDTEEMTDAIQRFVAIATPVARIALRGARFTRVPWVLVASSAVSIGLTVRNGVRELQAIAALLAHRFEQETGSPADPALILKADARALSQAATGSGSLGSQPAARPTRPAVDRKRSARSKHPEEHGTGAGGGRASRSWALTKPRPAEAGREIARFAKESQPIPTS